MPLKKIHHFVNKSYIIWNLKFGQVYIFDLPLLLTQNNYLNYSKIKPYALIKKIHCTAHEAHYFILHVYPYYYTKS